MVAFNTATESRPASGINSRAVPPNVNALTLGGFAGGLVGKAVCTTELVNSVFNVESGTSLREFRLLTA